MAEEERRDVEGERRVSFLHTTFQADDCIPSLDFLFSVVSRLFDLDMRVVLPQRKVEQN